MIDSLIKALLSKLLRGDKPEICIRQGNTIVSTHNQLVRLTNLDNIQFIVDYTVLSDGSTFHLVNRMVNLDLTILSLFRKEDADLTSHQNIYSFS